MLDERWIRSLHVESMRRADLHRERESHVLFQASTIGALLDGGFEGDLSFGELAEHGDLGLGTLDHLDGEMIALDGASSCAIRLDGGFELVRARSVPRQEPPYRPLTEVVADQHVFELTEVEGTMVGFRFPTYVEGIEVAGYHLHFASADRSRGGHVLGSRSGGLRVRLDPSNDLHVELPPRVDLADPDLAAETHAAVEAVERG